MTGRVAYPWYKKINPLWWLVGPDGWVVPTMNNGTPYLPGVTSVWLRRFYWFICRNPLMNFVGFVIGVEDRNYSVTGSNPVLATTGRDTSPAQLGWRFAVIRSGFSLGALAVTLAAAGAYLFLFIPAVAVVPVALLKTIGFLPYVSYYNGAIEFYLGWRPASGGFGLKLVFHATS